MESLGDFVQSFQALSNIVQALRSLKDKAKPQGVSAIELNEAIIEMQAIVMDAQQAALAAQTKEKHLVSRITALEQEVRRSEDFDKEKARYVLANVADARRGTSIAYKLRDEVKGDGEPTHYLCQNCYENGIKSILQPVTGFGLQCLKCMKG